jgi:hypothetical protein
LTRPLAKVDLFPQEITRALLNLISNGFYAASKRKAEANGGDYEPTLSAATKNLGDGDVAKQHSDLLPLAFEWSPSCRHLLL